MDCIFIVSEEDAARAEKVLQEAWDSYWEDGDGSELADLSLLSSRFYLRFQMQYSQQLSWLEHSFCHAEFLARKNQPQTEAALVTDSMTPEHLDLLLQSAKKEGITLLSKIVVL